MRRTRRKNQQYNVSLFPFLAVLICTIGVLIVMLVMAAKSADMEAVVAQEASDEANIKQIESLQNALDLRQIQLEGIKMVRPDALERLAESRANRSHIEDHIRELKKEFEQVGQELLALSKQDLQLPEIQKDFSEEQAADSLSKLEEQVTEAKQELQSKRELAKQKGTSTHKIVPYNGNRGTFRKPIFIECLKDKIVFQPSGIRLNKNEFQPPLDVGNMIDSALLAVREYWQKYDLIGDDGLPYPLIVVRPEGAETFVLARRAMRSWDDEFGYELVTEETELDFGTRDPQLEVEMRQAINDARRRQNAIAARRAITQGFTQGTRVRTDRSFSRPGLTASGTKGGFVSSQDENVQAATALEHYGLRSESSATKQNKSKRDFATEKSESRTQSSESRSSTTSDAMNGNSQFSQANGEANASGQMAAVQVSNPYQSLSVAQERGADWALPARTPGATGFVRPIRVICHADSLEVTSASGMANRIRISGSTVNAVDPLVSAIWETIDSWGIPGADGYWKPQLRFTIQPGAEKRFLELKGLLYRSGLGVEESQ